jgi:hypothetical protein
MNAPLDSQPRESPIGWLAMKRAALLLVLPLLLAAAADARPFAYKSKTRFAEIDFTYSAEAAAVPALVKRFRADLARERTRTVACGREETKIRVESGSEGIACASTTGITTSGQTLRLLSLASAYWAFTGGAHGNGSTSLLLWDRRAGKEIKFDSLFASRDGYAKVLRDPYCRALAAERKKRRGNDYEPGGVPEFDTCPKFSELALIPADSKHRGRFDTIHLIAAPYTAGPYAEGDYDIALPVTRRLVAAL